MPCELASSTTQTNLDSLQSYSIGALPVLDTTSLWNMWKHKWCNAAHVWFFDQHGSEEDTICHHSCAMLARCGFQHFVSSQASASSYHHHVQLLQSFHGSWRELWWKKAAHFPRINIDRMTSEHYNFRCLLLNTKTESQCAKINKHRNGLFSFTFSSPMFQSC